MPAPGKLRFHLRAPTAAAKSARRARVLRRLAGALVTLVCVAWPTVSFAEEGPDKIDVSTYPKAQQENYKIFSVRCSKCHALSRAINARIRGNAWKPYIKKMTRRPGSGINEEAGERIFEFLKYYGTKLEAAKK